MKWISTEKTLRDFYGDPAHQKKALWESLRKLQVVESDQSNLEDFIDDLPSIVISMRRVKIHDAVIESRIPEIKAKLPSTLLDELERLRIYRNQNS